MPVAGERCERCTEGPPCAPGGVCSVVDGRGSCEVDVCRGYCLNGGTCATSAQGVAACACAAGWAGVRCELRARAPDAAHDNDTPPRRGAGDDAGDDAGLRPHQSLAECEPGPEGGCVNGGRCVATVGGQRCACAGGSPWGGSRCSVYVGYDHTCKHLGCPPTTVCVWRPTPDAEEEGTPFCACLEGATCPPTDKYKMMGGLAPRPPSRAPPPASAEGGALHAALATLLVLALLGLLALLALRWRRRGAFVHARLADNVEINNPMYLAGDDDADAPPPAPPAPLAPLAQRHANGSNHFANPVYESMYAQQQNNPVEEHANLLEGEGAGGAAGAGGERDRAALL
ncbi:neurogenic locus notch homolog protein 4-like [Hyposmocoma kahamanoa]|uniref:neurogenic locus notch homolog protein 4-like n=1 Tax=Hyposmocoma kahamanoa TaxID=1477025 RepID=UPI000E6D83F3|nr:neurogenic locus notch homolog protein 4-like [Hyposmocoma kahamanoa]